VNGFGSSMPSTCSTRSIRHMLVSKVSSTCRRNSSAPGGECRRSHRNPNRPLRCPRRLHRYPDGVRWTGLKLTQFVRNRCHRSRSLRRRVMCGSETTICRPAVFSCRSRTGAQNWSRRCRNRPAWLDPCRRAGPFRGHCTSVSLPPRYAYRGGRNWLQYLNCGIAFNWSLVAL
jgi:hypothetical protein